MIFSTVEVVKTKNNDFYIEWDLSPNPTTTTTTPEPTSTTTTSAPVTTTTSAPIVSESADDYNFQIFWANDPASGFLAVLDDNGDPVEIDGNIGPLSYTHHLKQYDFNQDRYYKILAIKKDLTTQFFSETVFIGIHFNGHHDTMRYAEYMLYGYYHGEPSKLIKRKSFGARCPKCWSSERQQMILSHCDVCNGTGYATGWYQPIQAQISFDSAPKKTDSEKEFENVYNTKRARMSNYPIVRAKDIVINSDDDKRYTITHVETTKLPTLSTVDRKYSKQNYVISQLLTLEEIVTDDNEYNIDIDNIPTIPSTDDGNSGGIGDTNYRYYGVTSLSTITAPDILNLNKEPCSDIANTHIYDCTGGKYIWVCYPSRFGLAKFIIEDFETTFNLTVISVTNDVTTENYNCYRSYRLQHGADITVAVTK